MAIVTYPLNGIMYNAENAETYLCTRTSGVYSADDNFSVQADGTMQVTVNPGLAWIKNGDFAGKSVVSTEPVILSFAMADGVLNRKDRIVLRFDVGENATNIVVKQGTPASTAEPKPIERTGTVYELGLYVVDIPAGTLGLSAANITSTMLDESVCGIMRDGVTGIPTAQLQEQAMALMEQVAESVNQWEQEQTAEFEEWFEGIKGVLDGDTAGNLLNMIQQETTERKAADSAIESKLGVNATAVYEESTVKITAPEGLVVVTFLAPSDCKAGDKYTLNGDVLTLTDLNGEPVEDAWKQGAPVTLTLNGNKAFFKAGGGGKLPSDLAPLCPNFKVERNGTKVKISADKIQLNSYTNMVSGGVWAWGKTRPVKPTGENTKQWSRAELITTGKPYDGLYLGDVTPSDAVTETLIYLPENDGGSVKLIPFIVLSTDYLGGVYVMRQKGNKDWVGKYGNNVTYENSTADTWLTSYLNSVLDKSIVDKVLECEIHVFEQGTIKRKCWIPSYGELYSDFTDSGNTFMPYFNSNGRRALIKQDDGNLLSYWTRTFYNLSNVRMINPDGSGYFQSASNKTAAYRPAFVLPKDFKIQQRPDGSYTVWNEQGLMTLGDVEASTESSATILNGAEDLKAGGQDIASFIYAQNGYFGNEGALAVRSNLLNDVSATGANYPASNVATYATQYATAEASSASISRTLSSSLRAIITSANLKYRYNDGSQYEFSAKGFVLSVSDLLPDFSSWNMGEAIPCFGTQTQRIAKKDDGAVTGWWTRDNLSATQNYFIDTAGGQTALVFGSPQGVRPCVMLPLTAPIRALADGTYDLVPDDPAIGAQTVSTLAEEEVPLEIELDWPESDPLIARQWVYNEKGVYQTMLLGGIASAEDAPAYSPVLAENTWEQIAQACADHDPILDSWLVGDEKDEVINGETLTFAIVGKDHDDKSDGTGKAKLTFGMTQLMSNTRQMNGSNTNAGSFAGSALYAHLRDTILPGMPEELRAAIKPVNKPTSSGSQNSTIRNDSMSLWLFSEVEIFGGTTYSFGGEGFQYPYFATAANRVKRLFNGMGEVSLWWERSPYSYAGPGFCCVTTSGAAHYHYASTSYGVCFGFCIG